MKLAVMNPDRWALVGLDSSGRHLLERWSVRADFPLVAVCDPSPERRAWAQRRNLTTAASLPDLLDTLDIDGVILTRSPRQPSDDLKLALQRRLKVLVEDELGPNVQIAGELAEAAQAPAGVFQLHQGDQDFAAAQAAVASQRLGRLCTLRFTSCELGLADDAHRSDDEPSWKTPLYQSATAIFEQMLLLTGKSPVGVQAWADDATAGFHARIEMPDRLTVWLDMQWACANGLRTGWVIDGAAGAYRQGRLYSLADDRELLEETMAPAVDVLEDTMAELRRLAADPAAARQSLERSLERIALREAIAESIVSGQRVDIRR